MMRTPETQRHCDAAVALNEHLLRIDHQLAQAGVPREERDTTLPQIAEQFYDRLPQPPREATPEQVDAALASIGSDLEYRGDQHTRAQLLGMLATRLVNGTMVPLVLNDHGDKRIVGSELATRLTSMALLTFSLMLIAAAISGLPLLRVGNLIVPSVIMTSIALGIWLKVRNMPVHTLPRAADWPDAVIRRHRWSWAVMFACSGLFVFVMLVIVHATVAMWLGRPLWPIDRDAGTPSLIAVYGLMFALWGFATGRRRHRRRRVGQWAAPAAHQARDATATPT